MAICAECGLCSLGGRDSPYDPSHRDIGLVMNNLLYTYKIILNIVAHLRSQLISNP